MHVSASTEVFILFSVVIAGVCIGYRWRLTSGAMWSQSAYERVSGLLTPAERSFFGVLEQAVSSDYRIFAKVRLADLVRPVAPGSRSEWQRAFNRISSKHVDFILCDPKSLSVLGAVELDDQSHQDAGRRGRDAFVDEALRSAGIPVVRFEAKRSYHPGSLRQAIQRLVYGDVPERSPRQPGNDFFGSNTPAEIGKAQKPAGLLS